MQVYLHGIDEAVLQAALTSSKLWDRIQLMDSLQASHFWTWQDCIAMLK